MVKAPELDIKSLTVVQNWMSNGENDRQGLSKVSVL
jgi:hypothetical protein